MSSQPRRECLSLWAEKTRNKTNGFYGLVERTRKTSSSYSADRKHTNDAGNHGSLARIDRQRRKLRPPTHAARGDAPGIKSKEKGLVLPRQTNDVLWCHTHTHTQRERKRRRVLPRCFERQETREEAAETIGEHPSYSRALEGAGFFGFAGPRRSWLLLRSPLELQSGESYVLARPVVRASSATCSCSRLTPVRR